MKRVLLLLGMSLPLFLAGSSAITTAADRPQDDEHFFIRERGGYLGVTISDRSEKGADSDSARGARVSDVAKESPAEKAGIKVNDVIVAVGGNEVEDRWDLVEQIRSQKPGSSVTLTVLRDGRRETLSATLGKAPHSSMALGIPRTLTVPSIPHIWQSDDHGLTLTELGTQLAEYFGAPNHRGVLVEEVEKGSSGEKAGFKAGDVIIRIGKESIEDPHDVWSALGRVDQGKKAEVEIIRRGNRQTLALESTGGDEGFGSMHLRTRRAPRAPRAPLLEGETFHFNSPEFERRMEEFGKRMESFGKELDLKMKDMDKKLKARLQNLRV